MLLNALNLIYCKLNIAQTIFIEHIENTNKGGGALEVFSSVVLFERRVYVMFILSQMSTLQRRICT